MVSKFFTLFAVSALTAVSAVSMLENMDHMRHVKWVQDVTPAATYFSAANLADTPSAGGQHPHDRPPRAHGDWIADGVLEIESGWECGYPTNRTTFPVGHCSRNFMGFEGEYMVLLVKHPGDGSFVLGGQGFADPRCSQPVGHSFKSRVAEGCWDGSGVRYSRRRTPHPMGTNVRIYHEDRCQGAHADMWVQDSYCSSGSVFSRGAKSFIANCEYDYVVEFDQDNCMGMSTYHALHEMDLGVCHATRKLTYEVVCGGMGAAPMTEWPTIMPTMIPTEPATYMNLSQVNTWYGGEVSQWQFNRYIFGWNMGAPGNSQVMLNAMSGDPDLYVYFYNPMYNGMCNVGYNCFHLHSGNVGSDGVYLQSDEFSQLCMGATGCQILIGVLGYQMTNDYSIEVYYNNSSM